MSSLTNNIIPPPLAFWSILLGTSKPSIINLSHLKSNRASYHNQCTNIARVLIFSTAHQSFLYISDGRRHHLLFFRFMGIAGSSPRATVVIAVTTISSFDTTTFGSPLTCYSITIISSLKMILRIGCPFSW